MNNERAVIGGNNPPSEIEQFDNDIYANLLQQYEQLCELIDGCLDGITNISERDCRQIDELIAKSIELEKLIKDQHKLEKQPHIDAGNIIQKRYIKDMFDPLNMRRKAMSEKTTSYKIEQDRLRKEAANKAFREAEELRRKAELAEQSSHANIDAKLEAKALKEQAEAVHDEARSINNAATGLRSKKVAHIYSHKELYLWICEYDRDWIIDQLEQYAQRNIHNGKMAGVEIKIEKRAY